MGLTVCRSILIGNDKERRNRTWKPLKRKIRGYGGWTFGAGTVTLRPSLVFFPVESWASIAELMLVIGMQGPCEQYSHVLPNDAAAAVTATAAKLVKATDALMPSEWPLPPLDLSVDY